MKNVSSTAAFAVGLLLFSCNNPSTTKDAVTTTDSSGTGTMATKEPTQAETNSKNMRAVYNGIESGDMSVMDQFVADDIVDHDGPRGPLKGRDSVKKMLADMHNHIANLKFDMIAEATGGDYHFALTRISGKTKDGMMGMPPNTEMSDTSISMVKVVNGKVVEHWDFERHHYMPAGHNKMGKTK